MATIRCPQCDVEFLPADRIDQPERCPACGHRFSLAMARAAQAEADNRPQLDDPARRQQVTPGGLTLFVLVVLTAIGADVGLVGSALASPGRGWPQWLLLAGLVGHGLLSGAALAMLARSRWRAVLLGRLAVASWVLLGGLGVLAGGRLWPAEFNRQPLALLPWTGAALAVLLAYLAELEWLANRADARWVPPPALVRLARPIAWVAVAVNLMITVLLVLATWSLTRRQDVGGPILLVLASAAFGLCVLWSVVGLASIRRDAPLAAGSLTRASLALLAGATIVGLALWGGLPWKLPAGAIAAAIAIDALVTWTAHWLLSPPRKPNVAE